MGKPTNPLIVRRSELRFVRLLVRTQFSRVLGRRGPKSWREKAKSQPRMGMKARMVRRVLMSKSRHALQTYRSGCRRAYEFGADHWKRWGIPVPDTWPKGNIFGGVMWGSPQDYRNHPLSGVRCARLLELAWERGITEPNLKLIRKFTSCLFLLKTGTPKSNFPEVNAMFATLNLNMCAPKADRKPKRVVAPEQLKTAYNREWSREDDLCLVEFCQGAVASYDWCALGSRPVSDMNKIKESNKHSFDNINNCWTTDFLGGRSKLQDHKAGTRPWKAWRICLCPNEDHVSPPDDLLIGEDGNPFEDEPLPEDCCTTCPVFCGELLRQLQPEGEFYVYRKWNKSKGFSECQNHKSPVRLSFKWFVNQGVMTVNDPFCTHGGRKALGAWLHKMNVVYEDSVHIHGDLPTVFRKHYQPSMPAYNGDQIRLQAEDYLRATFALLKLRRYFGRERPPAPLPAGISRQEKLLLLLSRRDGCFEEAMRYF